MYNGGSGGGGRPHWQNNNNPNMAPLPIRPRPGLGAGPSVGPPPGMQQQQGMPMMGGPPPMHHPGPAMVGRPPPIMMGSEMPTGPMPASAGGVPAQTTLFVGNISSGVTDPWMFDLLSSCGPLRSFKRVNASFGFAEYADPDSVLRALTVLSGIELPALGADNQDKPGARKKLTVKADAKTRQFLDQYEQEKEKTEYDEQTETQARGIVDRVLSQMSDPANTQSTLAATSYDVPSHLKDLPPEELPEEHRGSVLSEIDKFRQASAAREEEKKRRDRVQELERKRNTRDVPRGAPTGPPANGRSSEDRQSYLRPVNFVGSETAQEESSLRADERDEREELRRKQKEQEDLDRAAYDAERRYLDKERGRLAHWERELAKENAVDEGRDREAASQRKLYEGWSQSKKAESHVFYLDRQKWRQLRRADREREERADEADRRAQAAEEERARVEAEKFLAQQAEEMAEFEAQQRAAGVLIPGEGAHAPLKLKVAPTGGTAHDEQGRTAQIGVLGNVEDDSDLTGLRRGKLAHIDLHDTDMDDNSKEARRHRVEQNLPKEAALLFEKLPKWQALEESLVESSYRPLLDKGIVQSIGESVPDMVEELIKKVRAHSSPKDLISVVEEVLEEEAAPLIEKLWRELLIDTMSA